MLQDNSIAWLTVFLIFSIFVPLFMNLWLRLVGAENHRSPHWSGQGTSISQFNASNISYSFKITLVSMTHSCSHRRTSVTPSYTFSNCSLCKIQVQRRFTTALFVTCCFRKNHTQSKLWSNPFFITPSSYLVHQGQRVGEGCFWNRCVEALAVGPFHIRRHIIPNTIFVRNVSLPVPVQY